MVLNFTHDLMAIVIIKEECLGFTSLDQKVGNGRASIFE
jgi:hypothetical protein